MKYMNIYIYIYIYTYVERERKSIFRFFRITVLNTYYSEYIFSLVFSLLNSHTHIYILCILLENTY